MAGCRLHKQLVAIRVVVASTVPAKLACPQSEFGAATSGGTTLVPVYIQDGTGETLPANSLMVLKENRLRLTEETNRPLNCVLFQRA
jgi:hypothetical protein